MADVTPPGEPDDRVEALLRINAELAAEIRSLTVGRITAPRSAAGTSARRVSRLVAERDGLVDERDALLAELEASRAELERLRQHGAELGHQIHEQARQVEALSHEVSRLRGGGAGILRRLRARLLRR